MKMTFCLQKQVPRFKLESGVRGTARMAGVRGQGSGVRGRNLVDHVGQLPVRVSGSFTVLIFFLSAFTGFIL